MLDSRGAVRYPCTRNQPKCGRLLGFCRENRSNPKESKGRQSGEATARSSRAGACAWGSAPHGHSRSHTVPMARKGVAMRQDSHLGRGLSKEHSTAPISRRSQSRVATTRRSVQPVKLVVADEPPLNADHPLARLSPSERQRQRLLKLAEVLAEAAKRKAAEQAAANGKEGDQ